jgi:hypothetical protein
MKDMEKLWVGARVYHSDEVSESFGTITKVTESDFSILWDSGEDDTCPLSFSQFISTGICTPK